MFYARLCSWKRNLSVERVLQKANVSLPHSESPAFQRRDRRQRRKPGLPFRSAATVTWLQFVDQVSWSSLWFQYWLKICFTTTCQESQGFLVTQTLGWENCLQRPKLSPSSSSSLFFSKMLCDLEQVTYILEPYFLVCNVSYSSFFLHNPGFHTHKVLKSYLLLVVLITIVCQAKNYPYSSLLPDQRTSHYSVVSVFQTSLTYLV